MSFRHDRAGTPAAAWREHPGWGSGPGLALVGSDGAPATRLVVVAAHPDDESLGAAGLIATAHGRGLAVEVVVATAGEHSHPRSPTLTPDELARRRRDESAAALEAVAPGAGLTHLGVEDGRLAEHADDLVTALVATVGDGRGTILLSPWRHDGHPDHEAAGRAAAVAAHRTGARHLEYPIWFWHWGEPDEAPWARLVPLPLAPAVLAAKRRAIAAHRTQVEPLSALAGDEVLLGPGLLAHAHAPVEHFVEGSVPAGDAGPVEAEAGVGEGAGEAEAGSGEDPALDDLHRRVADPWGVDTRWFEERKRGLVAAMLPRRRFARGLELGCSTGALAAELATRCAELVAVDASPTAVAAARRRLADVPTVSVQQRQLPGDWPPGRFDLVVLSEVGYFLSPAALDALIGRVADALTDDGVVLLCHWRHPVVGWVLDGPDVHRRFRERLGRPEQATYVDPDVEVSVLAAPGQWPEPSA